MNQRHKELLESALAKQLIKNKQIVVNKLKKSKGLDKKFNKQMQRNKTAGKRMSAAIDKL